MISAVNEPALSKAAGWVAQDEAQAAAVRVTDFRQRIVEVEAQREAHRLDVARLQAAGDELQAELTEAKDDKDLLRAHINVSSWSLLEYCIHAIVLSANSSRVMCRVPGL